jgi:kynureninase
VSAVKETTEQLSLSGARQLDAADPLSALRQEFQFPEAPQPPLYFAGHSLGLMPSNARRYVDEAMSDWGTFAVEGHFKGDHPWMPYHEFLTPSLARLVGALPTEVVAMNSLTVNLHLLLVSFYRPTRTRYRILIENNAFPSDRYAVDSQAKFHGFDASDAIVELKPEPGETTVRPEAIQRQIESLGESLALVLIGDCNYLSGQAFPIAAITQWAHAQGALAGFNFAHGAGNLLLSLHEWKVDFAVWCSYKYLNAGPGAIAGAFVHEKHHTSELPRWEGWWGHDKATRFKMGPKFQAIPTVEAWQLSNPSILSLASLRASLELFDRATMPKLRQRGDTLTKYLDSALQARFHNHWDVITPATARGSMLSLRLRKPMPHLMDRLKQFGVYLDYREPGILRLTPAPLFNSFEDIIRLTECLSEVLHGA